MRSALPVLTWNVYCVYCCGLIDTITEDSLMSPPEKHWQEAMMWGYLSRVAHEKICPARKETGVAV